MLLNSCWRRLLRVLWTARRSNQSIKPEYSLEGLMLKLKFQYFGHLKQRAKSLEKPCCWEWLKTGGKGDNWGQDNCMAPLTQWTWVWASSRHWWRTGKPSVCCSAVAKSRTWLSDGTIAKVNLTVKVNFTLLIYHFWTFWLRSSVLY